MQPSTRSNFDELLLGVEQGETQEAYSPQRKPKFKTNLQFSDYGESPPLPGTPVIPLLKLGVYEPFELEADRPDHYKMSCISQKNLTKDSLSTLPSKGGSEKEDNLSIDYTRYSSAIYTDVRGEDSEDEGVMFAPLANPSLKVWVMDDVKTSFSSSTAVDLSRKSPESQRGTSIFEILKVKKPTRPRLGTN
jgi:hypothetical protein